jgi:hypothetical protein
MGSGYAAAKNTITTSEVFNQVEMNAVERNIANHLKNLPNVDPYKDTEFNLAVEVEYNSAKYPEIVETIAKQSPAYNYAERVQQLEQYFANVDKDLRFVQRITYSISGSYNLSASAGGGQAPIPPLPPPNMIGPDIHWGFQK